MNVFIQGNQSAGFRWQVNSAEAVHIEKHQGSLDDLAEFYRSKKSSQRTVFIYLVNALDCVARRIFFSEKERKHIQKAIPYLLEESVLTDVDQLHIAKTKAASNYIDVMAVDNTKLSDLLTPIEEAGIHLDYCFAESALLQSNTVIDEAENEAADQQTAGLDAQTWQFVYSQGVFILADGKGCLSAVEQDHMALACEAMTVGFTELPKRIVLFADLNSNDVNAGELDVAAFIPGPLQHLLEVKEQSISETWQQRLEQLKAWNLLTGKFATTLQWQAVLKPWRWVLAALALVFVAQTAFMWLEAGQYNSKNQALRGEMDQLFRKVIPRGNIVDHRKQLERELKALNSGSSGVSFLGEFEKVGAVLAKAEVQDINSMNYESNNAMLRLDFLIKDYDSLQSIITALKNTGFDAEIQNSNAQGDQLRARLKVTLGG
jgi:general secretion pathway protein L